MSTEHDATIDSEIALETQEKLNILPSEGAVTSIGEGGVEAPSQTDKLNKTLLQAFDKFVDSGKLSEKFFEKVDGEDWNSEAESDADTEKEFEPTQTDRLNKTLLEAFGKSLDQGLLNEKLVSLPKEEEEDGPGQQFNENEE